MSKRRDHHTFAPWFRDLKWGAVIFLPGVGLLYYAMQHTPMPLPHVAASMALMFAGGLLIKRGMVRWTGKQVEQSAVKSIKLPTGWSAKPNYMLSDGGDIDLYIESPDGERFAVEIKAMEGLEVKHAFLNLGQSKLTTGGGKKLREDPQAQTLRNAEAVLATPVLWLPKAKAKTTKLKNGIIVVQGNKRALLKAIGCRSPWSWW